MRFRFFGFTICLLWGVVLGGLPSHSQVKSDPTVQTQTSSPDSENFTVTAGQQVGNNLFHSFEQFSVPTNGSVYFDNAPSVTHIFSRVTGNTSSQIDGLIRSNHSANLFLLNPNGIQFGPNARLKIGGSFIASTADHILFRNGFRFSAVQSVPLPLLTMTAPVGLQLGVMPAPILVQARRTLATPNPEEFRGLVVQGEQALALVGGDITLDSGILDTRRGNIELGSITNRGLVGVEFANQNIDLDYRRAPEGGQIDLINNAQIRTLANSESGGKINIHAKQLRIDSQSLVRSRAARGPGGEINIHAKQLKIDNQAIIQSQAASSLGGNINLYAEQLRIDNQAAVRSEAVMGGAASVPRGDILIRANTLRVATHSVITAPAGAGVGGSITIDAQESVEVVGNQNDLNRPPSEIAARAGIGDAGNLTIKTQQLRLLEGGKITSSTFLSGKAGIVTVDVGDTITISGASANRKSQSAIFSQSPGKVTGDAGSVSIRARRLIVDAGGEVSVGAILEDDPDAGRRQGVSSGNAGTLNINVSDLIQVQGSRIDENGIEQPSALIAEAEGEGSAGNLTLTTQQLQVLDGAEINVRSLEAGQAGNINALANQIILDNRGKITAETDLGDGGNINLAAREFLTLRNRSIISTSGGLQGTAGNGGNISIATPLLLALPSENSDISTDAFTGNGGTIRISAQGVFGLQFRPAPTTLSDITANSQIGIDGTVNLSVPEVDPSASLSQLPVNPIAVKSLDRRCTPASSQARGRFVITHRGGMMSGGLRTPQLSQAPLNQLATPQRVSQQAVRQQRVAASPSIRPPRSMREAQGWVTDTSGLIRLTAATPALPALAQRPSCSSVS